VGGDGRGGSGAERFTIPVTGTSDTPSATYVTARTVAEAAQITGRLTAVDAEDGAGLTYSVASAPAGLTIDSTGAWTFDATDAAYNDLAVGESEVVTVNYTVADAQGASSANSFTITVTGTNDAPVAIYTTAGSVNEGAATISGALTSSDADTSDVRTYSLVGGAIAGLTINANGNWTFEPTNAAYNHLAAGASEAVTVNYLVSDGQGGSDAESFTITVTGTNDTPSATYTASSTVAEAATNTGQLTASEADDGEIGRAAGTERGGLGVVGISCRRIHCADDTW